jgi:hypothetical protein
MDEIEWHRAKCRGAPTHIFYPASAPEWPLVLQACRGCPIIHDCRDAARSGTEEGIWGGVLFQRSGTITHPAKRWDWHRSRTTETCDMCGDPITPGTSFRRKDDICRCERCAPV